MTPTPFRAERHCAASGRGTHRRVAIRRGQVVASGLGFWLLTFVRVSQSVKALLLSSLQRRHSRHIIAHDKMMTVMRRGFDGLLLIRLMMAAPSAVGRHTLCSSLADRSGCVELFLTTVCAHHQRGNRQQRQVCGVRVQRRCDGAESCRQPRPTTQ